MYWTYIVTVYSPLTCLFPNPSSFPAPFLSHPPSRFSALFPTFPTISLPPIPLSSFCLYLCLPPPPPLPLPFSLLLQQVGEVITLVHVVGMFVFLAVQLLHSAPVALLSQQQLLQHASVCVLMFLLQTVQLRVTSNHISRGV